MNSLHRYILGAVGLAAMVAVFWFFGDIVFYVLIAGVLAIMCQPLVSKVTGVKVFGRNIPRWVGAVAGVAWRRAKKKVQEKLGIDEDAGKEKEAEVEFEEDDD